jgi:hypothetical protein
MQCGRFEGFETSCQENKICDPEQVELKVEAWPRDSLLHSIESTLKSRDVESTMMSGWGHPSSPQNLTWSGKLSPLSFGIPEGCRELAKSPPRPAATPGAPPLAAARFQGASDLHCQDLSPT